MARARTDGIPGDGCGCEPGKIRSGREVAVKTRVMKVSASDPEVEILHEAAEVLDRGGLVVLPTETVYGLAACVERPEAVRRLRSLKERPPGEPFPVQVPDRKRAVELLEEVPLRARPLMKHFWPGPLTIVFPRARLSAGGEGVGVRVPAHPVASGILSELGKPLLVPSCNPRRERPAVSGREALEYFEGKVELVLDAGLSDIREASTVVKVTDSGWEILREGLISREMIEKLIRPRTFLFVCTGNTCRSAMAAPLAASIFAERVGLTVAELGKLGFRFVSAGTEARARSGVSDHARSAMAELGIPVSGHRSRRLTKKLIREADLILCMEAGHAEKVLEIDPEARPKTRLLRPEGIEDPIGGALELYRRVRDSIREALLDLLSR